MQPDRDPEEAAGTDFPCSEERAPRCKEKHVLLLKENKH